MPSVTLHQFQYSQFNEKVRWALDWKGVAHERQSYLPGPHMLLIRRLSGQTQTPVLQVCDEIIARREKHPTIAWVLERCRTDRPARAIARTLRGL